MGSSKVVTIEMPAVDGLSISSDANNAGNGAWLRRDSTSSRTTLLSYWKRPFWNTSSWLVRSLCTASVKKPSANMRFNTYRVRSIARLRAWLFSEEVGHYKYIATLNYFTALIISNYLNENFSKCSKIILCGGGRKNKKLTENLKNLLKKNIFYIDDFNFDGDFIESQAFAYLAIRSYLKKNISFPNTTKVSKPITGGEIFKNF